MTKQFYTWVKNPTIQRVKIYENPMDFPIEPILDKTWHPAPSNLKLNHSHEGDWARLSVERDDKSGPLYKNYHIVRVEKYIDEEGDIKKSCLLSEGCKCPSYMVQV